MKFICIDDPIGPEIDPESARKWMDKIVEERMRKDAEQKHLAVAKELSIYGMFLQRVVK